MFRGLSSSAAATIATLFFTAIGGIMSARLLLPTGKGQMAAIVLWPTALATFGSLGLIEAVTYYCARQGPMSRDFLSTSLLLSLGASMVLMAAGYVLLPHVLSNYDLSTVRSARAFLIYIPITLTATLMMAALQGNQHHGAYNILRALVQILTVAGMACAIAAGRGTVRSFAVAILAANILTLCVATILVSRNGWIRWPLPSTTVAPLLGFGLKSQMGSIAAALNLRLDQMLMSIMVSAPLLGMYVVAVTVAGLTSLPFTTLSVVVVPRMAREADPIARLQGWGRLLRLSVFLQLLFAATLWMIAPSLVRICFGAPFVPSATVARILIVASLPLGVNVILGNGFRASNMPLTPSAAEALSVAVTAAGLWCLLPRYGIVGAAWTSLLAYGVTSIFLFSRVHREFGLTPRELLEPSRQDWRDARRVLLHWTAKDVARLS